MKNRDKKLQFLKDVINYQFKVAGYENYTYEDAVKDMNWFEKKTITEEQEQKVKDFFIKESVKRKIYIKPLAERQWQWFNLSWGLKIKNNDNSDTWV